MKQKTAEPSVMATPSVAEPLNELTDLAEGDTLVISLLASEPENSFSFQGIRRKLRLHQEKLSRILTRLERAGLVERTQDGYMLSTRAKHVLGLVGRHTVPSMRTLIDTKFDEVGWSPNVVTALRGRWFEGLRWLGHSAGEEGLMLEWVTEDGRIVIRLRVVGRRLVVETNAQTEEERRIAVRGAYSIVRKMYELALGSLGSHPLAVNIAYSYWM